MTEMIHCFEQSGLGLAPFEYLYCVDSGSVKNSCQYCGTGIRYKFFLKSNDGKEFFVGSDCIFKSGDAGLIKIAKEERSRMAKERREARQTKSRQERQAKWDKQLNDKIENFYAQNLAIKHVLDWASQATGIAQNIYSNIATWGNLTEAQIDLLVKLFNDTQKPKVDCPKGQMTIEGTVVSTKYVHSQYGGQYKMTVESNEGYRIFGTVPKVLNSISKGDKIRFVANVEPSADDSTFGFFNRPKQAVFV